ncbi:type I-F CRISPR-associated protein Csy2 [Oceanimonas smirnovii]|uniref:type I-F CRISPR-associated protein Csy2 n=1 Tax=Oceanimonas smirnovii TaxID=264574 RepID=UPI00037F75D6|nr:type I-F CRISPR-associated protein Csy2 [Oceanimonas smirnovii]
MTEPNTLLILPRLRIQNANAISGNLTWGFPAMTAFAGLSHALERKCADAGLKVAFPGIGVVCHHHEAQVTQGGYQRAFHLTRNPVDKTGKTAAIVEEGRIHLEISLILEVDLKDEPLNDQTAFAQQVADLVATLRVAGGTVQPALPGQRVHQPWLINVDEAADVRKRQLRRLTRQLLPGFALVLRDDLLQQHLELRQQQNPDADLLDAWLDLSRLNHECRQVDDSVEWSIRRDYPGWLVPVPIGFAALSELYDAGTVDAARDQTTPFRFVEGLYSIGQWLSPHRFERFNDYLWYVDNGLDTGTYRLNNDYSLNLQDKEF